MSSPPENVPAFLVKNWRRSSQHRIYRDTHKMRHQTCIWEAAFVSLSPVTQTDASPQKASITLLWTGPTQPSPSPFIITFHERSFNESPQRRAAEYCFALFVLVRSVNASAHYLCLTLPFSKPPLFHSPHWPLVFPPFPSPPHPFELGLVMMNPWMWTHQKNKGREK